MLDTWEIDADSKTTIIGNQSEHNAGTDLRSCYEQLLRINDEKAFIIAN